MNMKTIVRHLDETPAVPCPYGDVRRVITGGEGAANVHVVSVTQGSAHYHFSYNETYYFLSGTGSITIEAETYPARPGTVVFIPAGAVHALSSDSDTPLAFIIFGTPPMFISDDRAAPQKPQSGMIRNRTDEEVLS